MGSLSKRLLTLKPRCRKGQAVNSAGLSRSQGRRPTLAFPPGPRRARPVSGVVASAQARAQQNAQADARDRGGFIPARVAGAAYLDRWASDDKTVQSGVVLRT
jgi:hypothetical protein